MDALALTFDDGPDEWTTPVLLDVLAECEARATFFVIAPRAAAHPPLIERMLAEGHCVGLHCDRHVRHSQRDRSWLEADTDRALSRLRPLGVSPQSVADHLGVTWRRGPNASRRHTGCN